MELDHHSAIHLGPVHVVDTIHSHQIARIVLSSNVHHVLVRVILILSLTIIQMLMNRNVLEVVLVLLLATQGQLGALIQLVSVAFPRDVHHNEILTQLILVRVVHSDRVVL